MQNDLTDVVTSASTSFISAAKMLFPEYQDISGIETPTVLEQSGENGPDFERIVSTRTVAGFAEFGPGSATLHSRLLFDACYPVLNMMSMTLKRPLNLERRRSIRLGVWVERNPFEMTLSFFAYAEICTEK